MSQGFWSLLKWASFDWIQATVYERFLGKTLQELNRMAGIFRPFTRAKSREVGDTRRGFHCWVIEVLLVRTVSRKDRRKNIGVAK